MLKDSDISDGKDLAENLLILLRDNGSCISDVVEDDGEILSNVNLDMLQESSNVELINSINFDLDKFFEQRKRVLELLKEKLKDMEGLEGGESIKNAVDIILDKNGEIVRVIEVGNDSLLGLRKSIKKKIDDFKEQQARLKKKGKNKEIKRGKDIK
ncbi:Hypothetical protein BCO_0026300 (plasmid) [Borrelia coriaceae ATCC 43381]|uniref:Uncharacterized protein n=1 Tax=Borrelia coriaceae ATCC 43381 TaxID=1408429 RepID=W5SWS3_9SPIR|nr:hypothetical protein [Borrelia coriaceae]AHH11153.1 Hypothetical protein BCO_0026300 [Borrelia coriaceae ATCC 43381]